MKYKAKGLQGTWTIDDDGFITQIPWDSPLSEDQRDWQWKLDRIKNPQKFTAYQNGKGITVASCKETKIRNIKIINNPDFEFKADVGK